MGEPDERSCKEIDAHEKIVCDDGWGTTKNLLHKSAKNKQAKPKAIKTRHE